MALSIQERKALGAYYTSEEIASALVSWAIRRPTDIILDPSFGGGVFLSAARRHLVTELRAIPTEAARQIFGADLSPDPEARHGLIAKGVPAPHLHVGNFFLANPGEQMPLADAVVGNPPYIRYHGFSGDMRLAGLGAAARVGVKLSRLCSTWAPFLVHAIGFVRDQGRLAMVLPGELMHAQYSHNVLRFLCRSFSRVTAITVSKRLFGPDTLEESVLLLAEGKGGRCNSFSMVEAGSAGEIQEICLGIRGSTRSVRQDEWELDGCWLRHLLPVEALEVYDELNQRNDVVRLGEIASVDVGVVTGCNEFFMLTDEEARRWSIDPSHRLPAVGRASHLQGLRFTADDFASLARQGRKQWMLYPGDGGETALADYLSHGTRRGVPQAYKCRVRPRWYAVGHGYAPQAFLTYMTNVAPRLVSNEVGATSTNTLHRVRLAEVDRLVLLQLGLVTTLGQLSAELVGRSYGGGVLKLEPTEAERMALPLPSSISAVTARTWLAQIDATVRGGDWRGATERADELILRHAMGIADRKVAHLHDALQTLRTRRMNRAGRRGAGALA